MQRFVAEQNIERFKALLAAEADEDRREFLARLIAEEAAKLPDPNDDPSEAPAQRR